MQDHAKKRLRIMTVWICRLLVGGTFIISGWAKAIDPWGFLIKASEYLQVWGLELPRELVLTGCVSLACAEFCTGVLVATGSLKRVAVWVAAALVAVMLPLTVYIAIEAPVSDCGCFGDFLVVSNTATLIKNIVLTALIAYLLAKGKDVKGIYAPPIQWLQITVSVAFPLVLAFVGYNVQPLVDFRPYKIGTSLFGGDDSSTEECYIYEKNGVRQEFTLDKLPDDTWEFVEMTSKAHGGEEVRGFEVRDEDGFEVNEDLADAEGAVLYLIVPDPDMQFLSRIHLTNNLYRCAVDQGVEMIGIAGASGLSLERWTSLAKPLFPIYSASPTALKQLVRGDAALVYTENGIVKWKRSLASLDSDFGEGVNQDDKLRDIKPVDNGHWHLILLSLYLGSLLVIYLFGLSPKILRLFVGHTKKNS